MCLEATMLDRAVLDLTSIDFWDLVIPIYFVLWWLGLLSWLWRDFLFLDFCSPWTLNSWIADTRSGSFAWLSYYLLPGTNIALLLPTRCDMSNYLDFSALEESSIL